MRLLQLAVLLFFLAPLAPAQSVGNGVCTSTTGTTFTATFPNNTTSGSTFVAFFQWAFGSDANYLSSSSPISDNNSNVYYNVGSPVVEVNSSNIHDAFYSFNTTNSPNAKATITIHTQNSQLGTMCIAEVTGAASLYPLDKFSSIYIALSGVTPPTMGTAGTANGATTPTTRDANEIVVGFGYARVGNISAGSGFTCVAANGSGTNGCTSPHVMIDYETVSSSGSEEATFSSNSSGDSGVFFTLTFRETGSTIASGFYWVQGNASNDLTNALTATVSLAVAPGTESGNHLVVVSAWSYFQAAACSAISSILDENSVAYTTTSMGASTCNGGVKLQQAVLVKAPSNAGKNITVTWANTNGNYTDVMMTVDDFYYTAGTVTIDAAAGSSPNIICGTTGPPYSCTGTTVSVPTSGDLVYTGYIVPDNGALFPPPYPGANYPSTNWIASVSPIPFIGTSTGLNNTQWVAGAQFLYNSPTGSQGAKWYSNYSGDDFNVGITAFKFVSSATTVTPGKAIIF